jgi:O-antigen/teichoic acid export membrane protein
LNSPTTTLARHTLVYAAGSAIGGISRLVLVPVIARTLATEEYGVFSLLLAVTNFLHLVFDLGLVTALIRSHNESVDSAARVRLRTLVFLGMPVCDLLLIVPLLFIRGSVSRVLFGTPEHAAFIALAIGIAFFAAQFQLYLGHLRAEDRSGDYLKLAAVRGAISLSITLVLVLGLDLGVAGFLFGNLSGPACVALVMTPRYLKRHGVDLAGARARFAELMRFGAPLVPAALGLWALTYLDIYLLRVLADLSAVGIYNFASELCLPVALLLVATQLSWSPFAFARARTEDGPRELARAFRHLFVALVAAALVLAVLRREILQIVVSFGNRDYLASGRVMPVLLLATILYCASQIFGTGLQVAGDTRRLPLLVLVAVLVNAGLNLLLIPRWREMGAAVATVGTNLLLAFLVLRESDRQFPIPFELGRLTRVILAGAIVLLAADALGNRPLLTGLGLRVVLLAVFPLVLAALRAVSLAELRALPRVVLEIAARRSGA